MYGHPVRVLNDPLNSISTIYYQGAAVTDNNPLPVSLGDDTITITGDITIPATISVASSASNPVHVHVTEISAPVTLPPGSNTIGNVGINGIVPVSLCNLPLSSYLVRSLPAGGNTIGNVGINGIVPFSLCNIEIGTYLTRALPAGSNTIGNVGVNGIVPVSLCNIEIGTYLTRALPVGSNTIGYVGINGIVPVSLCNLEIGAYLTRALPAGSNTIGNVGINGVVPVTLCNLEIGAYLTRSLPTGSNTIGNVGINGIVPVSLCNLEIGAYLTRALPAGSNTIGYVGINGVVPVSLCNLEIGAYLTRSLPAGSNTIGYVGVNGIVPVSLCNLEIGTYLTRPLPSGSNTIGYVGINGTIPVSFSNGTEIGTYLTRPLPSGSNTIGATYLNVNAAYVSNSNPMPVNLMNAEFTSKGALKTSVTEIVFFNTFQYGIETDTWDTSNINGGTAVFTSNISGVTMAVTNQLNSEVIRQTRNVMRYVPGRFAELTFAVRLTTPVAGIRRRFGLFNGIDGFYFEDNGGDYACVFINSNGNGVVSYTERVPRNNWNGDKLDGNGLSKIFADAEAQQIVTFEYEWYGGGQIIFRFIINGKSIIIHTFNTANRLYFPWSRTPFLPIRLEIKNITGVAGTHKMYQGSNSLINQGVTAKLGVSQSILTALTGYNMATAKTFYPVISIRLKPTALQGVVLPSYFQVGTLDNTNVFYKLLRNATVTGGTWIDMVDENAFTQYNLTSTNVITDGIQLDAGYVATGSGQRSELEKNTQYQIGRSGLGSVSDTITLAVASVNANKDAIAALTWVEQR